MDARQRKGSLLQRFLLSVIVVPTVLASFAGFAVAQIRLSPQPIKLSQGKSITLDLPRELEVIPAAEGLKRVRFFARSPDGRIFVTDLYNLTDNKRGAIYILDEFDQESGKFGKVLTYSTGLRNPNSVQFYTDENGQDWLYVAETHQLTRRRFTRGEIKPTDPDPQVLAKFPDYGLDYKYGGWHLTRTIAFSPAGKLYVSVGSSCNSCVEKEKIRASIIEMNPDGSGQREYARGLRNAVGMRWIGQHLFATNQGSDHLGTARPDETFYAVRQGADHGWPYCHSSRGRIFPDPKLKRRSGCRGVASAYASFPARSSALGFDLFDSPDSPASFKDAFVVSLHGSTNKDIGRGYRIVVMRKGEKLQDLVTGFLRAGKVLGRPCDILKLDPASFLFSDDHSGIVYLVRRKRHSTESPL
jgi:glucose/arabinose dehydrogenase